MNLQQLAQIGEFLGGISVLFTLIYLAIQLRGNTRAVQSAAAQQTHETLVQGYFEIANNADLNRIFRKGTIDYGSIDENEAGQFFAFWSGTSTAAPVKRPCRRSSRASFACSSA